MEEITSHAIDLESENLNKRGIDIETIKRVKNLYLNSEFKHRQLVQTIKFSESPFGIGKRYSVLKRIKN